MDETSAFSDETEDDGGDHITGTQPDPYGVGTAQQALNDAAKRVNAVWISFVLLCVYVFIATYTVTPAVLFREAPVKLPIFNADLPLKVYFLLAPLLIICLHAYLIVLAKDLAQKVNTYEDVLSRLHSRLDNSIIIRAMTAPYRDTRGLVDVMSAVIAGLTMTVLPVGLLLLTQLIFLPYQDERLTWAHRGFVILDFAVCFWLLWPFFLKPRLFAAGRLLALALTVIAAATSIVLATFSGEWIYNTLYEYCPQYKYCPHAVTATFFEGPLDPVDYIHHGGVVPFPNRMIVPDDPKLADIAGAPAGGVSLSVRGRNFRKAVLDRSNLNGVDFSAADLTEASLQGAKLEGAKFECGTPGRITFEPDDLTGNVEREASRDCAKLQQVNLSHATLDNATFRETRMNDAKLGRASLKGASFRDAHMNGAILQAAIIGSANFSGAELLGANFYGANGKNVNFSKARMSAATFVNAWLFAANFNDARLQGALLSRVELSAADFNNAHMQGADLSGAALLAASLNRAYLQDATLDHANIKGASFELASLRGASLKCVTPFRTAFWPPPRSSAKVDPKMPGGQLAQTILIDPNAKCENGGFDYGGSDYSYIEREDKYDKIGDVAQPIDKSYDWGGDYGWGTYANDILDSPEKLSPKNFEDLLNSNLADLPDKRKDYVRKAFERLKPGAQTKEQDEAEKAFWADWAKRSASQESHDEGLAARLESIACVAEGAPYVARSLLRARRFGWNGKTEEQINAHRQRIIARLKAASNGSDPNCPGAIGLHENDFPPGDVTTK